MRSLLVVGCLLLPGLAAAEPWQWKTSPPASEWRWVVSSSVPRSCPCTQCGNPDCAGTVYCTCARRTTSAAPTRPSPPGAGWRWQPDASWNGGGYWWRQPGLTYALPAPAPALPVLAPVAAPQYFAAPRPGLNFGGFGGGGFGGGGCGPGG